MTRIAAIICIIALALTIWDFVDSIHPPTETCNFGKACEPVGVGR